MWSNPSLSSLPGPLWLRVLTQIISTELYDFNYSYLKLKICAQLYGFKNSYLLLINCAQLYGFYHSGFSDNCGNNNKDEDNSPKTLNDKNHPASSQKFRQPLYGFKYFQQQIQMILGNQF